MGTANQSLPPFFFFVLAVLRRCRIELDQTPFRASLLPLATFYLCPIGLWVIVFIFMTAPQCCGKLSLYRIAG